MRLDDLAALPAGAEVTPESLAEAGLIRPGKGPAKLLANGELTHAVTVRGAEGERRRRAKRSSRPGAASRSNGAHGPIKRRWRRSQDIFKTPELKEKILVHAALPGDLPGGRARHGAGRQRPWRLTDFFTIRSRADCSVSTTCSSAAVCRGDGVRAGDHAVHLGEHLLPDRARRWCRRSRRCRRKRKAGKSHAVDALRHGGAGRRCRDGASRCSPRALPSAVRHARAWRFKIRVDLLPDHRRDLRDVAGRADHRDAASATAPAS